MAAGSPGPFEPPLRPSGKAGGLEDLPHGGAAADQSVVAKWATQTRTGPKALKSENGGWEETW